VRDSGIGIPPERLADIFKPFVQLPGRGDDPHGGLGVGLTLVKTLSELHGGTVEAHSSGAGRGCEFIVRLPGLQQAGENEALPPTPRAGAPSRASASAPLDPAA
jgi:signal transduction histidine kinase